ncbi:MAG: PilZ domain-containing protein [Candidatus Omnitrophota bacterium]
MTERRKSKRYPVAYPVEYDHRGGKKTLSLLDVSEQGLAFTSPDEIRENEELDLNVFLKKQMYRLKAFVVYSKGNGKDGFYNVGVQFLRAPEDFQKNLAREVDDIVQFCRESKLYHNKNLSIKQASKKYLENFPSS